jgi:hypothetical protein
MTVGERGLAHSRRGRARANVTPDLPTTVQDWLRGAGMVLPVVALVVLAGLLATWPPYKVATPAPGAAVQSAVGATQEVSFTVFLPLITDGYPPPQWFGVESNNSLAPGIYLTRTLDLGVTWTRLGSRRASWRAVQPMDGGPFDWGALSGLESELVALRAAGISPRVTILDSPPWATVVASSCAAIKQEKLGEFAAFVRALVNRYKSDEYGVHDWEFGNEPDVDPTLVVSDNEFGCWGDIADPYYGGKRYGEMLKAAGPVVREEDATARIWLGGLLLDRPLTTDPNLGRPELFLQGILEAGAAPWLDVIAYHSYLPYMDRRVDHDNGLIGAPWLPLGGNVLGKARYLRELMAGYGIDRPLVLNETALMCPDHLPYVEWCSPPSDDFYEMQADYLVRTFVRGISGGVSGFVWYTLNGPGWRHTGLLDAGANPRPAFAAYRQLSLMLGSATYVGPFAYGDPPGGAVEAYVFRNGSRRIHVAWAKSDQGVAISVPRAGFVEARDRSGAVVPPILTESDAWFLVSFNPIYFVFGP